MRQFDVFRNPSRQSLRRVPYLLVLPTSYLLDLPLTVVAPLLEPNAFQAAGRLNPEFQVEDRFVMLSPLELANIRRTELTVPVTNLAAERDRIVSALDFLFTGI